MKRRGSPAIKHGSSDSVTETGAQQGKSSSTATIRRTEGNGQEKSSGRASAENVGKIERRSPPSFNGSSNSVDETGARRGKSSSTVTIRQTEGNSQEKSSGRARDTAARRRMSAEERKNTPPKLGDADTVFVDENGVSMTYDSNDAAQFNPEGKTQDELLRDIMDSAEPLDRRYLYFGRFTDSFRTAMEKAGVEVKNLPVIMSYRDAYLAMESRENGRYQGGNINYHNLGIEGMKRAMENIGNPDAVIKSKKDGKIELFLDFVDYKGNRGLAIVQLDSNAQHSQEFIRANIVTSIYGRSRGDAYLEKAKSEGRLVYSKEEGPAQGMAQVQYKSDINAKPSSTNNIRQTEGNSQEKSSGKASVEVSGINNRMATELDGADTVFADGSISVLSEERKITPETSEEARCEILKDRTIRPASVEYDKLGDTDTAAIYDGLSAAQMAQAKKAIPSHCDEAGAASGRSEKQQDRISVPILQRECRRKCAASERVRRTLYDGCNDKNKGIRRRKKAPSRRKRRGHFSAIGSQHQHTGYLPECQGRRRMISEVCTGRLSERCAESRITESDSTSNGGGRFVQD